MSDRTSPCLTARRTGLIILETPVQHTQIELVIDQVAQCVFEGAGESLDGQIDGQELHTGVDSFVAGHRAFLSTESRWSTNSCSCFHERTGGSGGRITCCCTRRVPAALAGERDVTRKELEANTERRKRVRRRSQTL